MSRLSRQHLDETAQRRYAGAVTEALPWSPDVGLFHLFSVDLEDVHEVLVRTR